MNSLKNLKITNKILFALLIGVLSCIIISAYGLYRLNKANNSLLILYNEDVLSLEKINLVHSNFYQIDRSLDEKIIASTKETTRKYDIKLEEDIRNFENSLNSAKEFFYTEKSKIMYDNFYDKWVKYKIELQKTRDNAEIKDISLRNKIKEAYDTKFNLKTYEMILDLDNIIKLKNVRITNSFKESQEDYKESLIVTIIVNILIILFFVFLGLYTGKIIKESIMTLKNSLDNVANGNFSTKIDYKYKDELLDVSNSLNIMIDVLNKAKEDTNIQNWFKDGLNKLSNKLSDEKELSKLTNSAISFIARYLEAGMGALYILDKDTNILSLEGSYAFNIRDNIISEYKLKDGLIGQVAYEKQAIILKNIQRKERDISMGLIDEPPISIFAMPIIYENEVSGVIELATLKHFSKLEQDFLIQANKIIATMINSLIQNEKVKKLLILAQEAKAEAEENLTQAIEANINLETQSIILQEQSEEMKLANTKMEGQQEQLLIQAEEMRQTNAKMEEQNQEMEQQSEELNQTNKKLIEQQDYLKEEQERINRVNNELIIVQDELNKKAEQLEKSSQYKSEFLANMSHELRTPLNSVILLSQLMAKNKKQNLQIDEVEKLNVINKAGKDLLNLINDILDLSKIEAGKLNIEIRDFNISTLLEDQEHYFSSIASEKGINLIIENEFTDDLIIESDSNRISQILRNFMSNSFKFTKEGSVTLKLSKSNKKDKPLRFNVIDTGIGIPEEKQKLVFDAFSQADGSTSRLYGGTGLGLSISVNLAKLLGAEISLESKEGVGSNFSLFLPYKTPNNKDNNLDELENSSYKTDKNLDLVNEIINHELNLEKVNNIENKHRTKIFDDKNSIKIGDKIVLIVEDDVDFANSVSFTAKEIGLKSLIATTCKEGLELTEKYHPSCMILDLGLPDKNGMELLRELKSTKEFRDIPIHIVSADDSQVIKAKKSGAVGFQMKPVMEEELVLILKNMTNLSEKIEKKVLLVEDNKVYKENIMEIFQNKGLLIDGVETEKEAIEKIDSNHYDTIIIDLYLENGSGYSICIYVKDKNIQTPIIVHTGKDLTEKEELELKKISDSIILKTVNSSERLIDEVSMFLNLVKDKKIEGNKNSYIKNSDNLKIPKELELEGKKILIVDDDIKNIFVLTSALEETNADIFSAKNGREGVELLKKNPDISLVIMDIMMPIMNGYEAIEEIRKTSEIKEIPIIAATAKAMKDDREKCLSIGANDYISKPIDLNLLMAMVEKWISK